MFEPLWTIYLFPPLRKTKLLQELISNVEDPEVDDSVSTSDDVPLTYCYPTCFAEAGVNAGCSNCIQFVYKRKVVAEA